MFAQLRGGRVALVGRERELAVLEACLRTAREGGGASVVAISAEPGIGKSRLLEEFPARGIEAAVLRGGSSQAQGMPPYLPFLEALGDYLETAPAERLRQQIGSNAPALAGLLPGLADRFAPLASVYALSPEQERLRLYESVTGFLKSVSSDAGLVLTLDDVHWADTATLDLLVHIARRLARAKLVIVCAFRPAEAQSNPPLLAALTELNRLRLLQSIVLPPLEKGETTLLATGLLGGELAPDIGETLHLQAEGNPFFVEELGRALVENGSLVRRGERWELVAQPRDFLPGPIADALRQRLSHLPAAVVDLLRVAALIGRGFRLEVLASVTSRGTDDVEEHLLLAIRARLLRPESNGTFAFGHDKIREVLQMDLATAQRARLHQAIGEVLETESVADGLDARRLAELAFHFQAAGDRQRAARYALRAGEHALRASAAAEAITQFRAAVDLLGQVPEPTPRIEALLRLAEAYSRGGRYREAAESAGRAAELAEHTGARLLAADAWRLSGDAEWRQEHLEAAQQAFERAVELDLSAQRTAEAAGTLLRLAELLAMSLGQHSRGIVQAERAMDLIRPLADRRLEAIAYRVLGNLKLRTLDVAQAEDLLERALAIALELDDPALAADTCAHLANLFALIANPRRSFEVTDQRERLGRRTQDPFQLRDVDSWRALLSVTLGDWAGAERYLARGESLVSDLESPQPMLAIHWARGELRRYQARFKEAAEAYRAAVELARPMGSTPLCWYLGGLGVVLAELGCHEEALACLDELQAIASARQPLAVERGYAFAYLTLGFERAGEPSRAAACYPELLPYRGLNEEVIVDYALAVAAACGANRQRAIEHLVAAEDVARRAGAQPQLVLCLMWQAGLDASRRAAFGEAQQLSTMLQMQEAARRAFEAARRFASASVFQQLSPRQLEVLRLLAAGKSNRQIAETLVLTEGTVGNHVTAILDRLGVDNRAAAVAHALRHGLA